MIRDSVFARNGTEATGGAIFVADVADPTTLTLSGTTFEDNEAVGDGGAIWIGATATVRVTDSLFVGNAADGGGAFAYDGELRSDVAIEGTTFRQNRALDRGGAFLLDGIGAASIAITDSVFEGNQALRVGGAILVESELSPSLVVTSSVFEANDAGAGGVFAMGGDDAPTARFVESTVFGNTAFDGAAFYLGGSDGGALSVEGGAVTENVASGRAGGFYLAGSATLTSVGVDWGEGATENLPEDAEDFAAGAGASFTCTSDGCE